MGFRLNWGSWAIVHHLYNYLKCFSYFKFSFFFFSKIPLHFYILCRDKIKGQSSKNITLTLTKTLPKKYGQIVLSTYKLDFQNKNYI